MTGDPLASPHPEFDREPEWANLARVWRSRDPRIDGDHPTIAAYVVFAPLAHPWWSWHTMSIVHLRPWPGDPVKPDADLRDPTMTHEVMVLAIDPQHQDKLALDDADTWKFLLPPDVVVQVSLPDDAAAGKMMELVARAVADGMLVPDSDYRERWDRTLANTAEHVRLGGHPG